MLPVLRSLRFDQPLVFAVLLLALPLVLLVPRARLGSTGALLRVGIMATRLIIVALVVTALAAPSVRPPGHARAVVFALDTSQSMSPEQQQWARAWIERAASALPPGSHSQTVEFGRNAQLSGGTPPASDSTDLSAALRMAAGLLPTEASFSPEIVLLTDGWSNLGASPTDVVSQGVAVSYVAPPRLGHLPLAVVHTLDVPQAVRAGEQFEVSIDLQSADSVDAQLRLWIGPRLVTQGPVHLDPGETHLSLAQSVDTPALVTVRADLLVGSDTSSMSAVTLVKPAGRILVLADQQADADPLVSLLRAQGMQVDRAAPSSVPPSANQLTGDDAILLVNTPATSLSLDQQRTLQSYVQDLGRGLVVIGGARTFSPGGYQGTALDDMLPVAADPPIEPKQGNLALFLVIDRSGSMDIVTGASGTSRSATKMAMAREAASQAAELLQPNDTLGVIAFDSSFQWIVPPSVLTGPDDIKRAQDQISTIKAGGGTVILPPLEAAFQAAASSDAPLKHIILMTDGESNDVGYEDLISRMNPYNITLSTLAIGSDADTKLLSNLAHIGGGRYYFTERSTQIPQIASKETNILTRNAIVEGRVAAVVVDPSPILRSVSGDLPPLTGYVATTRKDRAVTALETERGHPLLAHWQYGLGRVVAWTSEAQQGWTSEWANWSSAGQFWSQAVRWALPAPISSDFLPSAQMGTDGRHVSLGLQSLREDGHFSDLQETHATIVGPDGAARQITLPQVAPGTYELTTEVSAPGSYQVLFSQGSREEVGGFSVPDSVELHTAGINTALLEQLANATGGHVLSDPGDLARP
ncbi:MAG: VWA domain-containing protein, partial [Chloroflexi bacterium]|nr:VWA domain-containing protein [Chloroflexota bacterium]